MTAAIKHEHRPSILEDYLREGYEITPAGTFYRMFDLILEARGLEEAGYKACVRFVRDKSGLIDAIELARLAPKKEVRPVFTIETNAAGDGAVQGNATGEHALAHTPALPQPCSFECPACHDTVRKPGLCASCDVFDSGEPDIAPMTGRVFYEGDALPDRFGGAS